MKLLEFLFGKKKSQDRKDNKRDEKVNSSLETNGNVSNNERLATEVSNRGDSSAVIPDIIPSKIESIPDIVSGRCFSLNAHVTVVKQPYNGQSITIPLNRPSKAVIRRDIDGGNIRVIFSCLDELKEKGIIQTNLDLAPRFTYQINDAVETASAEINNSYEAVYSGKEFISLFQITRQNGGIVSFLINNLPGDRDFYYLIILSEKELPNNNADKKEKTSQQETENPARPKGLKITRSDMRIEYKAYEKCTEYASRLETSRANGYLTPPYIFGDNSFTRMLCKEDCIFCHCPFYDRRLFEELRHNHRDDYDEWVMQYFKNFK